MTDLCVVVPTRGRPANAVRLVESWAPTKATAHLLLALDNDDPTLRDYLAALEPFDDLDHSWLSVVVGERLRLGPTLNLNAVEQAQRFGTIGFMGDDHLPRSEYWDEAICEALDKMGAGFVYGDDGIMGELLPTAVFISSSIVRALGYFCPPDQTHLYLDNAWKMWGERSASLLYLEDVLIEHLHPLVGKAEEDAGYAEVNSGEMWTHDEAAWRKYQATQLRPDIAKIRAVVQASVRV